MGSYKGQQNTKPIVATIPWPSHLLTQVCWRSVDTKALPLVSGRSASLQQMENIPKTKAESVSLPSPLPSESELSFGFRSLEDGALTAGVLGKFRIVFHNGLLVGFLSRLGIIN